MRPLNDGRNDLRNQQLAPTEENRLSPDLSPAAHQDADLTTVTAAWPTLAIDVRKMIVGVVQATRKVE